MGPPVGLQRVGRQHSLQAGRRAVLPAGRRLVAVSAAGEGDGPSSAGKEALLARIAAAKRYKETGGSAGVSSSSPSSSGDGGASSPGPLPVDRRAPIDYSRMAEFLTNPKQAQQRGAAGDVDGPYVPPAGALEEPTVSSNPVPFLERVPQPEMSSAETAQLILSATQAPGRGSATEAAAALAAVLSKEDTLDKNMRAEEFTQAQVERQKQIGAEILEGSYNDTQSPRERARAAAAVASGGVAEAAPAATGTSAASVAAPAETIEPPTLYQPKVSTWGAFPRPSNISEAYGGGRTLRPGQELESAEQKAAREAAYKEAMKSYREKMGLDVDPELEAAAEKVYEEGMTFFNNGALKESYERFSKASEMVPLRTKIGGQATLQKAIVLDSMGYSDEAKKLYKSLRGHAVAYVAKKAKQMSFGFEAATFLKADQFSYGTKKSDYMKYFRGFADRNKVYIASEEERLRDEELSRISSALAVGVVLAPMVLVASLAAQR